MSCHAKLYADSISYVLTLCGREVGLSVEKRGHGGFVEKGNHVVAAKLRHGGVVKRRHGGGVVKRRHGDFVEKGNHVVAAKLRHGGVVKLRHCGGVVKLSLLSPCDQANSRSTKKMLK